MLRIIFHKEPERLGGGITEFNSDGKRLIIDMGADLESGFDGEKNPEIEGLTVGRADVGAVLISHYHADHMGLLKYVLPDIPVYMSETCQKTGLMIQTELLKHKREDPDMLNALLRAHPLTKRDFGHDFSPCDGFEVQPEAVDHSALDSLAFFIKTQEGHVLFTGDYRCHGWQKERTEHLIREVQRYCGTLDAVITEGTHINEKSPEIISEEMLRNRLLDISLEKKYVLFLSASVNLDSIASMGNAAAFSGKSFGYITNFGCQMAEMLQKETDLDIYKYVHPAERRSENGRVLVARLSDLKFIRAFFRKYGKDTALVYSMWDGYVNEIPEVKKLLEYCGKKGSVYMLHSSGHGAQDDIRRLLKAAGPAKIIPMHTENFQGFRDMRDIHLYELHKQ